MEPLKGTNVKADIPVKFLYGDDGDMPNANEPYSLVSNMLMEDPKDIVEIGGKVLEKKDS